MDTEISVSNCGYEGIKRILLDENEIKQAVQKLGRRITEEYAGKPLLILGILNGCFIYLSDLCREIKMPCEVAFMSAKSYGDGTVSSGNVKIELDINKDISKYHVIVAEDIVDTGRTLSAICEMLRERNPLSLKVAALLDKPERRTVDFKADYILFTVPDLFVVGYGLDCGEKYRNLPFIAEAELD